MRVLIKMLITLCYVYLWVRFHKCYSVLIRNSLSKLNSSSFSFRICSSSAPAPASPPATAPPTGRLPATHRHPRPHSSEEIVFLQLGDKAVYITEPQVCDLSKWTVLLGSSLVCGPRIENISFIIEATGQGVDYHSPHTTNKKVLKWSDYCLPLACSPGQPFRAVAQASLDNFSRLGVAFIEDRLQLDNGLMPSKIVPVLLQESTLSELLEKQCPQSQKTETSLWLCGNQTEEGVAEPCHLSADQQHLQCRKGSLLLIPETKRRLEERRGSEPLRSTQDLGPVGDLEDHSLGNHRHLEGHGHHLHLSSCNECLELENSTILSVKYASAENIPDLPNDNLVGMDNEEESLDEAEQYAKGPYGQRNGFDCNSKPPNVLVYTGGCQERFQAVYQLLSECINMEKNIIYPLQPQQALNDPWLENSRLLVLAEEETLTPHLQTRFLTYLSQGGRVLGLASSLCPAGLCLEVREKQRGQISRLKFTREDSTELELSVLASGMVYIRDNCGGGEVELWGELNGDVAHQRDMVIVRVTHGGDGGEAVLCQVHLELSPDSQDLMSDGFYDLKVSNMPRYEVLTEILTFLGISCELNQAPAPSPIHLLATSQEAKSSFLKWLQTRADQNGILTLSKTSLRMVSSTELQDDHLLAEGSLPLVINSSSQNWTQFSMDIYSKNLRTDQLGRTLLYAEVVTSTMDLLEGLTLHLPKDVGLIVVAARQSQGRGRGKNAWLSPLGCAMFTLAVQVELSSRLGQRIPFLQHLSALAVVEAVRTLPGYQDIDLRVKWPNDIYYSNLMKLGGVLVTSTIIGSTFHLLIGCGVNVTNSNPTLCINDLIQQYNMQYNCSLQPLSCAQVIARTLTCLEALISSFQQRGPDAILPTYYKRWLHSGTQVRLWSEDGLEAEVVGLDHNGFLQVRTRKHDIVSVEPDGNSFDMLKNLVVIKQR